MEIERLAYNQLIDWENSTARKSLIIRGARQVGKTTLVRTFSKQFEQYIELNLEREQERNIFEIDDVDKIINAPFLLKGTPKNYIFLLKSCSVHFFILCYKFHTLYVF